MGRHARRVAASTTRTTHAKKPEDTIDTHDGIPTLTELEKARWLAARGAVGDAAEAIAVGDGEGLEASINQVRALNVDLARVSDSPHVPEDAGEYTGGLERILRRIPTGWGRWISCDAGWYPLVVRTDALLAQIDPGYEVHQVKEKWGALDYYAATTLGSDARAQMRAITEGARVESRCTCETCGPAGTGVAGRDGAVKTLCGACAAGRGYDRALGLPGG